LGQDVDGQPYVVARLIDGETGQTHRSASTGIENLAPKLNRLSQCDLVHA